MAGGRTGGAAPFGILEFDGAAEPRLTSGGEAGMDGVKFQDRLLMIKTVISSAAKPERYAP